MLPVFKWIQSKINKYTTEPQTSAQMLMILLGLIAFALVLYNYDRETINKMILGAQPQD